MFLINDVFINEEVINENFLCDLKSCKGACCSEGDYGAPLEKEEIKYLNLNMKKLIPYLSKEGKKEVENHGFYKFYNGLNKTGTRLLKGGHCVFLKVEGGIGHCVIEKAHEKGEIDLVKPISCHLYPIRVEENKENGFSILRYDRWEICSAACDLGDRHKVRIYEFLKAALIRKFGCNFYAQLEELARKFVRNTL